MNKVENPEKEHAAMSARVKVVLLVCASCIIERNDAMKRLLKEEEEEVGCLLAAPIMMVEFVVVVVVKVKVKVKRCDFTSARGAPQRGWVWFTHYTLHKRIDRRGVRDAAGRQLLHCLYRYPYPSSSAWTSAASLARHFTTLHLMTGTVAT